MTDASLPPSDPAAEALSALCLAWADRHGLALAVKDASSGRYRHVNESMARLLGRPAAEIVGRGDTELVEPAVATAWRAADQAALAQTQPLYVEHRSEWGGRRHEHAVLRVAAGAGEHRLVCSLWADQAALRQKDQQLRLVLEQLEQQQRANESLRLELADQTLRDADTGLYTGARFEDHLRRELDLSAREHREFAMVLIELDPFGDGVRALGAPAEARIFEAMGRLLRGNTRAMDAACRLEGGRFGVLLSGVGLATAHARMEGLRRQCAAQIVVHEGQELGFSVSMGVASYPHTASTQAELFEACEAALAEARRRGGNRLTLASIRFEP
jgi:diguanylate cyclase (GGDEF)-like protein